MDSDFNFAAVTLEWYISAEIHEQSSRKKKYIY